MYKALLLLKMIFQQIVEDYYLQGWLASAKQKAWWKQNAPDKLYEHDYIMALFMHSFSWTFMIMMSPLVHVLVVSSYVNVVVVVVAFVVNLCIHMFVDDMKANKKKINLIQDQLIHLAQVVATWVALVVIN